MSEEAPQHMLSSLFLGNSDKLNMDKLGTFKLTFKSANF